MMTSYFSPLFTLSIALIGALALSGLTGCQSHTPALGVGVPIDDLPEQQGVPVQGGAVQGVPVQGAPR